MRPELKAKIMKATGAGMTASALALAVAGILRSEHEGRHYVPYQDTGGKWTVCEGVTGEDVIPGKRYTEKECDTLEKKKQDEAEQALDRQIKIQLHPWARGAMIDWVYNLGEGKLASSTLKKKFNAGDIEGGCAEMLRWIYGDIKDKDTKKFVKKKLKGLERRRSDEYELCTGKLQ